MLRKDGCWVILFYLSAFNIFDSVMGVYDGSGSTPSYFEDCTGYPTLANSNAFTGETTHGSVLTVICNSGYLNTGAEQCICNNGEWESNGNGGEPYCARQCAVPSLENGRTNLNDNGCTFENCTILFTCDTGYILDGQHTLTCQASGIWGFIPTCQIADCGRPTISNGTYNGSTTYGSTVDIQCTSTSYNLAGSPFAVCGADGKWSELPACIYNCGAFPNIPNASLNFSCSGEQLEGCSVLVSCGTGFSLTGNSRVPCFAGQGWGFRPSCIISTSGTSYNVSLSVTAPPRQRRAEFASAFQAELLRYYIEKMGENNAIAVNIKRITYVPANASGNSVNFGNDTGQNETGEVAVIEYTISVADTPEAKGEFSSAHSGLVTTESLEIAGNTTLPLQTTFAGLTLQRTNRSGEAVKEASCQLFTLTNGTCPSGTECHVYGNGDYTACEPVSQADDDFGLEIGLGVGIPLFLLASALIGLACCFCLAIAKRKRKWRRKKTDDSETSSGFYPFVVPAMFVTYGTPGPLYGSYMSDGWEDAASIDSNSEPRHEEPYFVPVGYTSEQNQITSSYSWDNVFPHLDDDRCSIPRPRIH